MENLLKSGNVSSLCSIVKISSSHSDGEKEERKREERNTKQNKTKQNTEKITQIVVNHLLRKSNNEEKIQNIFFSLDFLISKNIKINHFFQ